MTERLSAQRYLLMSLGWLMAMRVVRSTTALYGCVLASLHAITG